MKVRCSNGLQVSNYHGNFLQHTFGADLEIGSVDADKAIGVLFSYDGKLDPKLDAHFQAALLYTSANGQRRVRCINVVAAVNEGGMETMKFIDQDAVVNMMAKEGKFLSSSFFVLPFFLATPLTKQPLPKCWTNHSRTFGPASQRKPWIFSVATVGYFQVPTRRDNWCCRKT